MQFIKELWSSRELLGNLVLRETRGQYKRTILGRLWSLMNPLVLMLVFTFIFLVVFRIEPEPGDPSGLHIFPLWLLCGLLPWGFFAGGVTAAANSLVGNAGLIQKVYFPRAVLPIAAVGTLATNWLVEMAVLVIALVIVGSQLFIWLPGTIGLMILLAAFAVGLGSAFAIMTIHFRDTQYLLTIVMQVWMYLTPIIYPASRIKELSDEQGELWSTGVSVFDIYTINPMYHFVTAFRQLLYDNRWPDSVHLITCATWAVAALLIGAWVFSRNEKRIAEML